MKLSRGIVNQLFHQAQLQTNACGYLLANDEEITTVCPSEAPTHPLDLTALMQRAQQVAQGKAIYCCGPQKPLLDKLALPSLDVVWVSLQEKGVLELNVFHRHPSGWQMQAVEFGERSSKAG